MASNQTSSLEQDPEDTSAPNGSLHQQKFCLKQATSSLKAEALRRYKSNHRKSMEQHRADIEAELASRRKHAPKSASPGLTTPDIQETPETFDIDLNNQIYIDSLEKEHMSTSSVNVNATLEEEKKIAVGEPDEEGRHDKKQSWVSTTEHVPCILNVGRTSTCYNRPLRSRAPTAERSTTSYQYNSHGNQGILAFIIDRMLLWCLSIFAYFRIPFSLSLNVNKGELNKLYSKHISSNIFEIVCR